MRTESGKLNGESDLTGVHLTGMVVGDAFVGQDGQAVVDGVIAGNLTVAAGSVVRVNGTITGDLITYGATVVAGLINGSVVEQPGGQLEIAPGALIGHDAKRSGL